jgi:hypothetical protein
MTILYRILTELLWMLIMRPISIFVMLLVLLGLLRYSGISRMQFSAVKHPLQVAQTVEQAADELADQVANACPKPEKTLTKLFISPIESDRNAVVESALRRAFQKHVDTGFYQLVEKNSITKTLDIMNIAQTENGYSQEIAKLTGAEFLLTGKIDTFSPAGNSHEIHAVFRLLDLTQNKE